VNGHHEFGATLAWPAADRARAIAALAERNGCFDAGGADAQEVEADYRDLGAAVGRLAPGLIRLEVEGSVRLLAVLRASRGRLAIIAPDLSIATVRTSAVCARLCEELESAVCAQIDDTLARTAVPTARRPRARRALLRERLGASKIGGLAILRPPPEAGVWSQARFFGLHRRFALLLLTYAVYYALWIGSWVVIGGAALNGQLAMGWMVAWALTLFTLVPFRIAFTWVQGSLMIGTGSLLKRRLLAGAMHSDPDRLRKAGVGQLLGRVMESSEFESLALNGGLAAVVAGVELLMASIVLAAGTAGAVLLPVLLAWLVMAVVLFHTIHRRICDWTDTRVHMTHDFVESMVGHRTRLAQEDPSRWHDREEQWLARYGPRSRAVDGALHWLAVLPRGWLLIGLGCLGCSIIFNAPAVADLAVGIGAVLLCYRALNRLAAGLQDLAIAASAWRKIRDLFAIPDTLRQHAHAGPPPAAQSDGRVIEARGMRFRHPARERAVLADCELRVRRGDRILLEGSSGSGKSTLASILAGLRSPDSGLLLLNGLDAPSWGHSHWRRKVVMASQFGDNHVFMGTFAFNLLMGRQWPASLEDMRAARQVCSALGLDELLQRMPGGMMQMVGDTGWQLSHGEKSRVYVARALLQGADLLILDESFASLDPENTWRSVRCVLGCEPALLVIAHT
jgi:ATP-binding cassette subfamily B protein